MGQNLFNLDFGSLYFSSFVKTGKENQTFNPLDFNIGDGENQINFETLSKFFSQLSYKNKGDQLSFSSLISDSLINNVNSDLKEIVEMSRKESTGSEDEDFYWQQWMKLFDDLMERHHKDMEMKKFYKKMDKISGNLDLNEMLFEVKGTSSKYSNMHITDFKRLNDLKLHSSAF